MVMDTCGLSFDSVGREFYYFVKYNVSIQMNTLGNTFCMVLFE